MSFITKRERVFKDFNEPVEIPARNEGKLKAYSSCTDARAWSHFCSDKTEHLIEIIKRNNEVWRGKYVPISVLIEVMMATQKAEIARLKRKITQLEQMLIAYDQLELSCDQKCEISAAHAMIKAANKTLDELPPLELDMSEFTEGIDSDRFQTGKSGGDDGSIRGKGAEWLPSSGRSEHDIKAKAHGELTAKSSKASKINQSDLTHRCGCDVSTSAKDGKVEELEEVLISKDAKLSAMQNTIAVMENDVCEPYCVYAHIYTALEKIFGTLRQNEKYKIFLDLMSSGRDTRCLDIKGKILFKLKVLEKFSIALISPCSERFKFDETCECYTAQIHVDTNFAFTQPETRNPADIVRTQLVADIMDNDEMKDFITKDNSPKNEDRPYEVLVTDTYSIDTENLSRLKALQIDYDDLMNHYEDVKIERDNLKVKIKRYEELDKELEDCRNKLREYNVLYNEREYYRKRSEDLDSLREQYMVLSDETSSLENQLKAETEINHIKTASVEELRNDNVGLEKKISELTIAFEKERNSILCKLKEAECKIMCQDQQIRSLSSQIDKILEQDHGKQNDMLQSAAVLDEIEALKDQIKSLNDALYVSEDEKQQLQEQFEDKLKLINDLKMEIEEWKGNFEKTLQRNDYLEKYTEGFRDEVRRLVEENRLLSQEVEEKTTAVANLIGVINNKSHDINRLMNEIESKREENKELVQRLQDTKDKYESSVSESENAKNQVLKSLQLARQESKELLDKVKDYDDLLNKHENISKTLLMETESCNELKTILSKTIDENKRLQLDLSSQEKNKSILLQEIKRLRDINKLAVDNIQNLQNDNEHYRESFELTRKESEILEGKLKEFEDLQKQLQELRETQKSLIKDKNNLENELINKKRELDNAMNSEELTRTQSEQMLLEQAKQSENLKEDMIKLNKDYHKLVIEKDALQKDLAEKNIELDRLLQFLSELRKENEELGHKANDLAKIKRMYDDMIKEKGVLQSDFENKSLECNNLYNTLQDKIKKNRDLVDQIKALEKDHIENVNQLKEVNLSTQITLNSLQKESEELIHKLKNYEGLFKEYEEIKQANNQLKLEKMRLQKDFEKMLEDLKKVENDKENWRKQAEDAITQNEDLEKTIADVKYELKRSTVGSRYHQLAQDIEEMKNEKQANNKRIKELLDKLDEADNIISNLNEEIMTRDDRIAILDNHINSLQDEVKLLHQSLSEVVDTGEQFRDNSMKKIDQSLNKLEAHHSKATHNMKMELAKLQNRNSKLEEQLSVTKIKSEESFRDSHKYMSQLIHLQNEREIIVTDIKQLELSCVGDSNLLPSRCSVEEILSSLDKIRKCIEARNHKSSTLEQALLKVQTSSQLLVSKADEAKRLVEKEKLKIINEKEDAIADKLNMEKQLLDLKIQLEHQTAEDKGIIKDLEAEILNQKLIIDKLNASTQNYITKLEEEMQSLQSLYQNSIEKINKLQEKNKALAEENDNKGQLLNKIDMKLAEKSKEVSCLQKDLDELKNKPKNDVDIQVGSSSKQNTKSQTDKLFSSEVNNDFGVPSSFDEMKESYNEPDINVLKVNKQTQNKIKSKDMAQTLNEVQILAVNVEPTLDYVKSSYRNYKKKRLGPGKLEQYSIDNTTEETNLTDSISPDSTINPNIVDIYYKLSDTQTISSKANKNYNNTSDFVVQAPQTSKSSRYTDSEVTQDIYNTNNQYQESLPYPKPGTSSDKDLFLIYHDSESSQADDSNSFKEKHINSRQRPILVEAMTMNSLRTLENKSPLSTPNYEVKNKIENLIDLQKQSLEIKMPRMQTTTTIPTSDETITDVSSKQAKAEKTVKKQQIKEEQTFTKTNELDELSKIEESYKLFKEKAYHGKEKRSKRRSRTDFGLEYIMDSVQNEIIPVVESHSFGKLHKSRSEDLYQQLKGNSEDGPSNRSPLNITSSVDKTSQQSQSKWSDFSHPKPVSLLDQGVMVNIDAPDYYENRIRQLSQKLENTERDCKKKMEAIKARYDNNIKGIINEHNQGVKSIQSLHEETLQDIIKMHENEVENLRSMSIEAMRKADKLERENRLLKSRVQECTCGCVGLDEEPIKMCTSDLKKRKSRCRSDMKTLTKTNIEAFNVKPKRFHGPCTCSLDVNISDTIRNIFEQVDVEQRKLAEHAYLKYISNKIMTMTIESLDIHELSFLHLKVCRTWKNKLNKEEALQKKIDTLEVELMNKQRYTQQHLADLDRKVAEERRRLQEAREAVCRSSPVKVESNTSSTLRRIPSELQQAPQRPNNNDAMSTSCSEHYLDIHDEHSAGDLGPEFSSGIGLKIRPSKPKPESRAVLAKLDNEERRGEERRGEEKKGKKMFDEQPTRLRRSHERPPRPPRK